MSSKASNKPVKGQTNLFSFFKKPVDVPIISKEVIPPSVVTPIPDSGKIMCFGESAIKIFHSQESDKSILANNVSVETNASLKNNPSNDKEIESTCQKRKSAPVLLKEDNFDDEYEDVAVKGRTSANKKPRKTIVDDEEEWNDSDDASMDISEDDSDDDDGILKAKSGGRLKKTNISSKPPLPKSTKTAPLKSTSSSHFSITAKSPDVQEKSKSFANFNQTPTTQLNETYNFITPSPSNFDKTHCDESESSPDRTSELVSALPEGVMGRGSHEHNSFDFLKPQNRCDKAGKKMNDPDFNPRTLLLKEAFLKDQTPAMQQWWQVKSENMDTVLFFKVGKFYELFHMDADVGMAELDLIYMKGPKAHSGFPEVSYGKFASILVSKGYRVARVEQTETPEMLKERNDSSGKKKDKVVRRELCSVMSKGTRTYCHLDDLSLLLDENSDSMSESILLCIHERKSQVESGADDIIEYGVCCIDTVLGNIVVGQFQDDSQRCRLRTFLLRHNPTEILLHESQKQSVANGNSNTDLAVLNVIRLISPKALVNYIRRSEFPSVSSTLKTISDAKYYDSHSQDNMRSEFHYPSVLEAAIEGVSNSSSDLLICAFGACIMHLRRALIDFEILSMRKMFAYIPPDEEQITVHPGCESNTELQKSSFNDNKNNDSGGEYQSNNCLTSMTIDAIALANLEVLVNNYDQSETGSLWAFLNRCKTNFGKRLLKSWITHPLFRPKDIQYRADAVEDFLSNPGLVASDEFQSGFVNVMKSVPDLERLLSRIHSNALAQKFNNFEDHPDTRAVMYESQTYNLRKIKDFADILTGFESLVKIGKFFSSIHKGNTPLKSRLLIQITQTPINGGKFPYLEMESLLKYYRDIFDEKQAKKEGFIRPKPGVNVAYDNAKERVKRIEQEFETYLSEVKRQTNIQDIKYFGSNKDRYQLEIPMSAVSKVPSSWTTKSQKKTHRRYWTTWIENKLGELTAAEDQLSNSQNDTIRQIFSKFYEKYNLWLDAVTCCSTLDALHSLAEVSSSSGYVWPTVESRTEEKGAYFEVENGRHPMLEHAMALRGDSSGYIPNSVTLGGLVSGFEDLKFNPKLLLLTGPNMGGKSTLLRKVCLITIMAQIGCKVPADRCKMTSVDRIFTRVGASDRILSGQSTFFVELAETAMILKFATEDSICILDELGRGTATFDGTAIAHAVIDHLVRINKCRSLFATHYHSLVDDWEMDPRIRLGHMSCVVHSSEDSSNDMAAESSKHDSDVTFLYQLCDGSSPSSYGINVAKLAGLPREVIDIAIKQSIEFESRMKLEVALRTKDSHAHYKTFSQYFDRLVSIANSTMSEPELAYAALEIWQRFKSTMRKFNF